MASETPDPNATLVSVLATTEFGLVPMARAALDEAGIDYVVSNTGISSGIMGQRSSMIVGETDAPVHVLVRAEDEAAAREVLEDFATATATSAPITATPVTIGAGRLSEGAIDLFDEQTGARIGQITDAEFRHLQDCLEEESVDDRDYFIDEPTLAMLQDAGAEPSVVALLRVALGSRDGMDVRWSRVDRS